MGANFEGDVKDNIPEALVVMTLGVEAMILGEVAETVEEEETGDVDLLGLQVEEDHGAMDVVDRDRPQLHLPVPLEELARDQATTATTTRRTSGGLSGR